MRSAVLLPFSIFVKTSALGRGDQTPSLRRNGTYSENPAITPAMTLPMTLPMANAISMLWGTIQAKVSLRRMTIPRQPLKVTAVDVSSTNANRARWQYDDLGAVAIGRNEGMRLIRCLESLSRQPITVVYVDSGSTDGSIDAAARAGAQVVELDTAHALHCRPGAQRRLRGPQAPQAGCAVRAIRRRRLRACRRLDRDGARFSAGTSRRRGRLRAPPRALSGCIRLQSPVRRRMEYARRTSARLRRRLHDSRPRVRRCRRIPSGSDRRRRAGALCPAASGGLENLAARCGHDAARCGDDPLQRVVAAKRPGGLRLSPRCRGCITIRRTASGGGK